MAHVGAGPEARRGAAHPANPAPPTDGINEGGGAGLALVGLERSDPAPRATRPTQVHTKSETKESFDPRVPLNFLYDSDWTRWRQVHAEPRVQIVTAPSASGTVSRQLAAARAATPGPLFTILDADHGKDNVTLELQARAARAI